MIQYLFKLLAVMHACVSGPACLYDAKDPLPEAKAAIDAAAISNPLDGWAPPKTPMPHIVPPATEATFNSP